MPDSIGRTKAYAGAAPTITGYTATNVVEVTLDDLGQVSKVIESAAQSGANLIQKLQYQLKNPSILHAQALREAAENAKTNAEAMASGLGLKAVRVLSVQEVNDGESLGTRRRLLHHLRREPLRRHRWRSE